MTLKIKKVFSELHTAITAALAENAKVELSDVLPKLEALMESARATDVTAIMHKNEAGEITHLFDSYFGTWMPVKFVDFGIKEGTSTGFNSMSKEGQANYSRQLREFKAAKEKLLEDVMAGVLLPEQIAGEIAKLDQARDRVEPHSYGIGFATLEEALATSDESIQAQIDAVNAQKAAEAEKAEAAQVAGV